MVQASVWGIEPGLPDVVLWGKRLKDGDGEGNSVGGLVHHLLRQQPGFRMVDVLVLRVLHPDVPPHAAAMGPVLPHKSCLYAQLHTQHRPAVKHIAALSYWQCVI